MNPTRITYAKHIRLLRRYQPRLLGYNQQAHNFLVKHNAEHATWHELRLTNFNKTK